MSFVTPNTVSDLKSLSLSAPVMFLAAVGVVAGIMFLARKASK